MTISTFGLLAAATLGWFHVGFGGQQLYFLIRENKTISPY